MRRDAAQAPGGRRAPGGSFPQLRPQLLLHLTAFPLAPPSLLRPRSACTAPTPPHTSRLRRRRPRPPGTRPSRGCDVPLSRRPRGGPRPAARLGRLGSGSGTRRDTEGHGGAQAQLPATVLSPETRLVRRPRRPLSPTWLTLTATLGVTRGVTHGSHCLPPLASPMGHTDCRPRRHPRCHLQRHPWVTLCRPRRHPRVSTDG